MRRRFPLASALEFRCRRMIPLANHKLTFDERIGCITRHDNFVLRNHREVSPQVAPLLLFITKVGAVVDEPVKRKTSEVIWFKLTSNRDFNGENFFSLSIVLPCDPFCSMANK